MILERFGNWNGEGQIFECSIFQNIITNQMLYLMMTEEEILYFYKKLKDVLAHKRYRIIISDTAYAVENAVAELKAAATGIIGSNEEDGVAEWLAEHVFM